VLSFQVYRGEHGSELLQSRLASYAFVDSIEVAAVYAHQPNNRAQDAVSKSPRVLHCRLSIQNPLVNTPGDPFIDFPILVAQVGPQIAQRLMLRHADHVVNTGAWDELYAERYASLQELVDQAPEELENLYLQLWPMLDCDESVAELKAAGIDGAIHRGSGVSMNAVEYRVFDLHQIDVEGQYLAPPADQVFNPASPPSKQWTLAELLPEAMAPPKGPKLR